MFSGDVHGAGVVLTPNLPGRPLTHLARGYGAGALSGGALSRRGDFRAARGPLIAERVRARRSTASGGAASGAASATLVAVRPSAPCWANARAMRKLQGSPHGLSTAYHPCMATSADAGSFSK